MTRLIQSILFSTGRRFILLLIGLVVLFIWNCWNIWNLSSVSIHDSPTGLVTEVVPVSPAKEASLQGLNAFQSDPRNPIQPASVCHPPHCVLKSTLNTYQELYAQALSNIKKDDFGNYYADISTPGYADQEWLYSSWPLFVPNQQELNEGVVGCASGGYYVSVQANATVVVIEEKGLKLFHYVCEYKASLQHYFLVPAEPNESIGQSLRSLSERYQLPILKIVGGRETALGEDVSLNVSGH